MRTGYEIREGSRMLEERIRRAQDKESRIRRLNHIRRNIVVLDKLIEREIKAA